MLRISMEYVLTEQECFKLLFNWMNFYLIFCHIIYFNVELSINYKFWGYEGTLNENKYS